MGSVNSIHNPFRTVLTPIASAVMLLVLTGWVGLAHKTEAASMSGTMVVPAIREALRMVASIPGELHQNFLTSLGSTLLTFALSAGGILAMVLKGNTEISLAKSRAITLMACFLILCFQLTLYANQTGAGLQAVLLATLGLLCCSNQCSMVRTTTTVAAVTGWLAWAGTSALG